MVVLAAPPDSMTQTPNPLLVTSAVHTTADPWTLGDATTWLIEATTRTLAEPVNLSGKTTSWQRVFEDVTFRASFPCWMELPVGKRTNKFMRLWTKAMRQQLSLSLLRVINVKFPLQPHQKYYITQYGELWLSLLRWKMLILRTNSHYTSLYTFPLWNVAIMYFLNSGVKDIRIVIILDCPLSSSRRSSGKLRYFLHFTCCFRVRSIPSELLFSTLISIFAHFMSSATFYRILRAAI